MKRPITDHEYQINGGAWVPCTLLNTTNNSDGTYTITDGLNVNIPIGQLKVRVKALGINPASAALLNTIAFDASLVKKYQVFFVGDSLTGGIGTTGTGSSASGQYFGANSYPVKTVGYLSGIDVTPFYRSFPGQPVSWWTPKDANTTISLFDYENFTDIYVVMFWGANDLLLESETAFEADIAAATAPLRAAGAKVLVVPVLSRKDSYAAPSYPNIVRRNAFNTWLLSNYSRFCDAIVDLSAHPEIFANDAPDNTTYFNAADADGNYKVHLVDAGADVLASCVANEITTLALTTSIPIVPQNYAADFIAATGITNSTQIMAINTLVSDLMSNKLWHRFEAIYPFVGGTADAHKFNLRNPVDTDAAYRLVYTGAATHDSNGVTWSSTAYADTKKMITQAPQTFMNTSLHLYSRSTGLGAAAGLDIGATGIWLGVKAFSAGTSYCKVNDVGAGDTAETYSDAAMFAVSRDNQFGKRSLYRNGDLVRDTSIDIGYPGGVPRSIFFGCSNEAGTPTYPSSRNFAYAAIGYGLTAAEEAAHYTIVQAFQTALGRAV